MNCELMEQEVGRRQCSYRERPRRSTPIILLLNWSLDTGARCIRWGSMEEDARPQECRDLLSSACMCGTLRRDERPGWPFLQCRTEHTEQRPDDQTSRSPMGLSIARGNISHVGTARPTKVAHKTRKDASQDASHDVLTKLGLSALLRWLSLTKKMQEWAHGNKRGSWKEDFASAESS